MKAFWRALVVTTVLGLVSVPLSAQGPFSAEIIAALRMLGWVTSTSTNTVWNKSFQFSLTNSYLNFGATAGTSGYGIRDNAGTIQIKDSGGSWTSFPSGGAAPADAQYVLGVANGLLPNGIVCGANTTWAGGAPPSCASSLTLAGKISSAIVGGGGNVFVGSFGVTAAGSGNGILEIYGSTGITARGVQFVSGTSGSLDIYEATTPGVSGGTHALNLDTSGNLTLYGPTMYVGDTLLVGDGNVHTGTVTLRETNTSGYSQVTYLDSTGVERAAMAAGNSGAGDFAGKLYWERSDLGTGSGIWPFQIRTTITGSSISIINWQANADSTQHWYDANNVERMTLNPTGMTFVGTTSAGALNAGATTTTTLGTTGKITAAIVGGGGNVFVGTIGNTAAGSGNAVFEITGSNGATQKALQILASSGGDLTVYTRGTAGAISGTAGLTLDDVHLVANYTTSGGITNAALMSKGSLGVVGDGSFGGNVNLGSGNVMALASAAPTISSGFGSSPVIDAGFPSSFIVTIGTGGIASTGVVGLPTAAVAWVCTVENLDNPIPTTSDTVVSAYSTNSVTFTNYTIATGVALAWTAGHHLRASCFPH